MRKHMLSFLVGCILVFSLVLVHDKAAAAKENVRLFQDVTDPQSKYFDAACWMKMTGIAKGYDSWEERLSFRPDISCSRADFSVFLWRLSGSPESTIANLYADVDDSLGTSRFKAILWITEQGISSGYPDHTFRPDEKLSREEAVIMLWRLEGTPPAPKVVFRDVAARPGAVAYKAISWARHYSLVKGYADGTFRPKEAICRGDAALILYRYARMKGLVDQKTEEKLDWYRANGDVTPAASTGLSKYIHLTPGIEIDQEDRLYEWQSGSSPELLQQNYYFQNYAFGYTFSGSLPVALMAFNHSQKNTADLLVAWDMQHNCEYARREDIDFDHGNAVVYNPDTGIFSLSTGTGDQKAMIHFVVDQGEIREIAKDDLDVHMQMYHSDYVTSGVVYLPEEASYLAQYAVPYSDDRMFAAYDMFSKPPHTVNEEGYRHHAYDYTGQSMYTVRVNDKQYVGFIYMTRSYYEEDGIVKSFRQGKADLYEADSLRYVGTQWFDPIPYEIESASVFKGKLYIAYAASYNKVSFYQAEY